MEAERLRLELQNAKRQTELVKSLLADATTEKEIMYEVCSSMVRQHVSVWLYSRHSTRSLTACSMTSTSPTTKRGLPSPRILVKRSRLAMSWARSDRQSAFSFWKTFDWLSFTLQTAKAATGWIWTSARRVSPILRLLMHCWWCDDALPQDTLPCFAATG